MGPIPIIRSISISKYTMTTWHQEFTENRNIGERVSDAIATFIGSWKFIIIQSMIFVVWVIFNTLYLFNAIHFDPYPFILFNLFMSAEAAYASPLILMSQNRQTAKDRFMAEQDLKTDEDSRERIELLQTEIARIEIDILKHVLRHVEELVARKDDLTRLEKDKVDPLIKTVNWLTCKS